MHCPELDKRRLGDVVDLFTNIQMIEHGSEKDILGRTYEYCLSMFAEQEGKRGGEFFTPSCVVRTLVEVLKLLKGVFMTLAVAQGVCLFSRHVLWMIIVETLTIFCLWSGFQSDNVEDGTDESCYSRH